MHIIINIAGRRKGELESKSHRDSISSLPDDIVGIILSLLPTKLAASTSRKQLHRTFPILQRQEREHL